MGERVRAVRQRRGWTAADLAARCAQLGAPQITHTVVTNMETGRPGPDGRRRRDITVDELLVLAAALDVPPPYLLAPLSGDGMLEVTPDLLLNAFGASRWLCGEGMGSDLPGGRDVQARFRRARRPLDVLRHAWLSVEAVTMLHERGERDGETYRAALAELERWLGELDGLGVPAPPLPRWLSDDLGGLASGAY